MPKRKKISIASEDSKDGSECSKKAKYGAVRILLIFHSFNLYFDVISEFLRLFPLSLIL